MSLRNLRRAALAVCCLATLPALAQQRVQDFELEQLDYNPSSRGGMLVGGSDLLPEHTGRLSLFGHYENSPLRYFEDGQQRAVLVEHRWTTTLAGAFSVAKWLELGAILPVVVYQNGQTLFSDSGTVVIAPVGRQSSLGTPWVQARVGLLREDDGHPLDLGFGVGIGLPVGQRDNLTRDLHAIARPKIAAGKSFGSSIRLSAELGALIRRGERQYIDVLDSSTNDVLTSRLEPALGISTLGSGVRGELSARAYIPMAKVTPGVEIMAGGRLPIGAFELFALAGAGLGNSPGMPAFRGILGVALGGVEHCREGKPHDPAKCPDLDADGDGIRNRQDKCPTVAGVEAFEGCPAVDRDNDGTTDDIDACVNEPGPKERKGCPARDADSDGIEDDKDQCPNDAGPADHNGCPVKDADKDTVEDAHDQCPEVAGVVENRGCPAYKQVELKEDRIDLRGSVFFDTAKATIQPVSFDLLREVALVMRLNPRIKQLSIDGHTDNRSSASKNLKLSEARAKSVRDFLVNEGIDSSRLVPRGFGQTRPIATNATRDGRERNRRVEFLILDAAKE